MTKIHLQFKNTEDYYSLLVSKDDYTRAIIRHPHLTPYSKVLNASTNFQPLIALKIFFYKARFIKL